jgi:hypothetical protein
VTEVLRRGFHLKPKGTKALRDNLKEIYRFRGMAVHPSGGNFTVEDLLAVAVRSAVAVGGVAVVLL